MEREKLGVWVERDWVLGFQRAKMIESEKYSEIGGQFFKREIMGVMNLERKIVGYQFKEKDILIE